MAGVQARIDRLPSPARPVRLLQPEEGRGQRQRRQGNGHEEIGVHAVWDQCSVRVNVRPRRSARASSGCSSMSA